MKKIINIILLLAIAASCKAQNPVLNISEKEGWNSIQGAYYKDIYNLLEPFEGTYIYTNGNTLFKIVLQKKVMSSTNGYLYEDLIIGEYQYIDSGIEKVNTLDKLNINYSDKRDHSMGGNLILTQGDTGCFECLPNEKALRGGMVDGASENTAQLIIRRIMVNNQPAIKIWLMWEMVAIREGAPEHIHASIPGGYYTLLKQ